MVRALALRSGDPGFKTPSNHSLNLILVVPALLNRQLDCLRPVGILNSCCCSVPSFCCVSLALKSPYGERSIKYVCMCVCIHLLNNQSQMKMAYQLEVFLRFNGKANVVHTLDESAFHFRLMFNQLLRVQSM